MLKNEENFIRGAASGDSEAFGVLYDEYHSRIYRFVFLKVSTKEDAEDLTHQVFVSAWESVGRYKHKGHPFSSWLYRIARNAIIDYYRTRKEEADLENVDPGLFAVNEGIATKAGLSLQLEKVEEALKKLKPEYQDVVIMRFIEELAIKEVAAAMDKTEGAIKLLQHRAIRELKRILSEK